MVRTRIQGWVNRTDTNRHLGRMGRISRSHFYRHNHSPALQYPGITTQRWFHALRSTARPNIRSFAANPELDQSRFTWFCIGSEYKGRYL